MALFKGETTAWEDVQIRLGNHAERAPSSPSMEQRSVETMNRADVLAKQEFVDKIFQKEEVEDAELVALRRRRIEQLQRQDAQSAVRRISKESYTDEVTEGSKQAIVVVLMDRGGGSSFLETECRKLAKEWTGEVAHSKGLEDLKVRFYVGDVDELISNEFPANSLPFAVIYSMGSSQVQMPRATGEGIRKSLLAVAKSTRETSRESRDEDEFDRDIKREIAIRRAANSDQDDSDDERHWQQSKGYSSTDFERNVLRYK